MSRIYITTYQFRIKDSNTALVRSLYVLSGKVNHIWNFVNNSQKKVIDRNNAGCKHKFWLNKSDLQELTKGVSKLINLPAQTIQNIQEEYLIRREQHNKAHLKNRTNRKNRNLPWIPFKTQDIKVDNKGTFTYQGLKLKTWYSSYIQSNAKITNGSIVCDNLGHWFINVTIKQELTEREELLLTSSGQNKTGIDIGLNPFLTQCIEMPLEKHEVEKIKLLEIEQIKLLDEQRLLNSNNSNNSNNVDNIILNVNKNDYKKDIKNPYAKIEYKEILPEKLYRKSEEKLGKTQKARRFKQTKVINKKIKNKRKDFLHKLSTDLVMDNTHIVMGVVNLKKLINKKALKGHAKSWTDNGYGMLKTMLKYKAHKHSIVYEEVSERELKSTQTCSCCGGITGPKGLEGLSVSQWTCVNCKTSHNRNENSAYNHLLARKHSQWEAELNSNQANAHKTPVTASVSKLS